MDTKQQRERFDAYWQSLQKDGKLFFAGRLLERAVGKWPERIAYICGDQSITYKELYQRACLVSNKLREFGVGPDDNIILWYENSIEFFIAYFGIWQTGAVVAALNVFLHPKEFEHIVADAQPKAVIISDALLKKLDESIKAQLPANVDQAFIEHTAQLGKPATCHIPDKDPDALAALLYTSGTTGLPKGVMLSSRNILTNTIQGITSFDVSPEDRVYMPVPLFHSLAQNIAVWSNVLLGSSCIIIPKIDRRSLLKGLEYEPTVILAVPALYGIFCMMKTAPFKAVRYFISGGDALPDKIRAAFELLYHRKICNGYGMTEASPLIAASVADETVSADTVGPLVIGMACSIRRDGKEVAPGDVGLLWVKGDNVMLGYYKAPELTDQMLKDGWLNTGDLVRLDAQGRLRIVGRQKDLIIHKGFNIYPQEIENILFMHPQVIQAAVIGVKDGGIEEVPVAYVAIKGTLANVDAVLKRLCKQQLASYKTPRKFIVKKSLPVTAMGKVDKKLLKAQYNETES